MKQKHILIVEDHLMLLSLLSKAFKNLGCLVNTALNGKDALKCLEQNHYDLILADIDMPIMDGKTLYQNMNHACRDRLVFMTSGSDPATKSFLQRTGRPCLFKPFDPDLLEGLLQGLE